MPVIRHEIVIDAEIREIADRKRGPAALEAAGSVDARNPQEVAPQVSVIGFHRRPSEFMLASNASLSAVLPRPVSATIFLYAVARALESQRAQICALQSA